MQQWAYGLIDNEPTAATVADVWIARRERCSDGLQMKGLFQANAFVGWRVTVPTLRILEGKAFTDDELKKRYSVLLCEFCELRGRSKNDLARWCFWLAAHRRAYG